MKNRYESFTDLMKTDERLVAEDGTLLKNKLMELAMKMDRQLLKLLLSDETARADFFVDADGIMVFDKIKFSRVIDSVDFVPDSYTSFGIDIKLVDEYKNSVRNSADVVLEFPYKDCVLEMDATDDKDVRNEVFLNETIMRSEIDELEKPKALANARLYDESGVHEISDLPSENLLIKGNNLLVLHSLLVRFRGRIKLMYWDILYNTDNDQVPYNDSFKHSSWLVMMKNRLEVARELLKADGIICLQCDDNEQAYLKVLCDEIFGRSNFMTTICVKMSTASGVKTTHKDKTIIKEKEMILVYAKNKPLVEVKPQYVPVTEWDDEFQYFLEKHDSDNPDDWEVKKLKEVLEEKGISFDLGQEKTIQFINDNMKNIWRRAFIRNEFKKISQDNPDKIIVNVTDREHYYYRGREMYFLSDKYHMCFDEEKGYQSCMSNLLGDFWSDINTGKLFSEGGVKLRNGKKPEKILHRLISMFTKEEDIVLDAYLGSGTTAAVAHKMNRKYIGIEQLDSHMALALRRMEAVIGGEQSGVSKGMAWQGGGAFTYFELAQNSQKLADRIYCADEEELCAIYDELKYSDFVLYRIDINDLEAKKMDFRDLETEDKKRLLISVIDKNTLYINYSDVDNADYALTEEDRRFSKCFYEGNVL